jgi:hypothetical protein
MWAIELVGLMLVGLAVILGAVVALPYVIAKAAGHDQAICDCWDCRNRRARAVEKAKRRGTSMGERPGSRTIPDEDSNDNHYWATNELRAGLRVLVKGSTYRVTAVTMQQDGNTRVELYNVLQKNYTMIMISPRMRKVKMWRKLELW